MRSHPFLAAIVLAVVLSAGCTDFFNALMDSKNPHGLTASQGVGSSVSISWMAPTFGSDDPTKVTGYQVYRDGGTSLGSTTSTSWSDSSIPAATEHSYYVTASLDKDGMTSTSDRSNSDSGWFVPAEVLKLGTGPGLKSNSSSGWFQTLVVEGWTYHFPAVSGGPSLEWAGWDSPWSRTSLGALSLERTWKADRTGKVWIKVGIGGQLEAWYE